MSPRKFFQRHFNKPRGLPNHRLLGWVAHRLQDPELWHFGRRSVAGGVGLGLFLAFVPIPIQMLLAPPAAALLRVNLPIALGALWTSNPITMGPLFIFAYKVGGWITGENTTLSHFTFDPSVSGLTAILGDIWYPLSVGCFVCGLSAAAVGNLTVRWIWRLCLLRRRRSQRRERAQRASGGHR